MWIKSVNERKTADKAARRDFRIRRERMKTSVIGFPRVKVCIRKIFQKRNRSRGAFKRSTQTAKNTLDGTKRGRN